MYQLSIVIAVGAYNKDIIDRCNEIKEQLITYVEDFEFIIVNNRVNRDVLQKLKAFKQSFPHITIISLRHQCAEEEAMRLGVEYAQGDFIVIFADGNTYPVSEIRKLYDAITGSNQYMVVNGRANVAINSKGGKQNLINLFLKLFPIQYLEKGYFSTLKIFRRKLFYPADKWENIGLLQYFNRHPNRVTAIAVEHSLESKSSLNNCFILPILPLSVLVLKGFIWLNIAFLFLWSLAAWFSMSTATYFTGTGISLALLILSYGGLLFAQKQKAVIADIK
jgi:hypothetical protein